MCRVANCCFCLDLERGSLIIGIIDIVLGILQLVTQAAKIAYVGLAGAVVELVAGILLVVGIKVRKPVFVLIFLIAILVLIILNIIALIRAVIYIVGQSDDVVGGLVGLVVFALNLALQIYFEIVVYSYYQEAKGSASSSMGMRNV